MRLRRSTPGLPDEASPMLVQLGDKFHHIPLNAPPKAEKLLFGSIQVSQNNMNAGTSPPVNNAQEGYEALARMKEALAEPDGRSSKYAWSPDHLGQPHPYDVQPNHDRNPERLDRAPSDAGLPSYYEPYTGQHLSPSSARHDMGVHQGTPTIFDTIDEHPHPRRHSSREAMKQHQVSRRQTTGHTKSLQLNHMFPTPRPSTGRLLSPNRLSTSPSSSDNRLDRPLPPPPKDQTKSSTRRARFAEPGVVRPSKSTGCPTGKKKVFDEDILDQHKTNVRRPPKGIQNWFDAYLESEDEDDDDGEEEEEVAQEPVRARAMDFMQEPQELPADDILPPAYSAPGREISRASEKSDSQDRQVEPPPQPTQQVAVTTAEQEEISRYRSSDCNSWDSIQSSHIGRIPPDGADKEISGNSVGGQSVLSLSESEYDDTDEEESGQLPAIRDSIFDDKNVVFASASSVALHKLQRPSQLRQMSSSSFSHDSEDKQSKPRDAPSSKPSSLTSNATPKNQKSDKSLAGTAADSLHPTAEQVALRRLNGLSLESRTTSSSDTGLQSGGEGQPPLDAQHVMAVTEEEKMLLDLMRRKRAVMQQLSFTEGYQLALLTEQQRLAKRTASAELNAIKALQRKQTERRDSQVETVPSPTQSGTESDMRRQLSAIRKEQVDEKFQLERFLGMSQPQPLSSHPPHEVPQHIPAIELPNNRQSAELLPSTVYSPSMNASPAMAQGSFPSREENDSEAVKRRVRYFIETKGAVPPLNTTLKTMRRKSHRAAASMPPSPVIEEEQAPAIPIRSPARHNRDLSNSTADTYHTLSHKQSSVSMDDEPRDKSPVSGFAPPMSRFNSWRKSQNIDIRLSPELVASRSQDSFLYQDFDRVSQPSTASPNAVERVSPVSPFSNIINAATSKSNNISQDDLPRGVKRVPLPRLHTVEAIDSRGSLLSITSAGEEVLAAWNDLGGRNDYLPTARERKEEKQQEETFVTPKTLGQGPLSGVMNTQF